MHRVRAAVLPSLILLLACVAQGQTNTTNPTNTFSTPSSWPIQFSIGPQQSGGLGAKVSGSVYWSPDWQLTTKPASGWFVFYLSPQAEWGSQSNALNQTTIEFRPAFQLVYTNFGSVNLSNPNQNFEVGPFNSVQPMVELYGDLREQYGEFSQNGTVQKVDLTLYGIGGELQVPYAYRLSNLIQRKTNANRINYAPAIRFTYYQSRDKSATPQQLPAGIQTNFLDINLKTQMPLGSYNINGTTTKLEWTFSDDVNRPTTGSDKKWKNLLETSLVMDNGSGVKPVISYSSGSNLGLQYDKQFLLGVAWQFGANRVKQ
jgi:hypothetical protein